jgi:hypothetical protein
VNRWGGAREGSGPKPLSLLDLLRRRGFQPSKHAALLDWDDTLDVIVGNEDDPDEERAEVAQLVQWQYRSCDRTSIFRERWLLKFRDCMNERPGWGSRGVRCMVIGRWRSGGRSVASALTRRRRGSVRQRSLGG